MKFLEKCSVEPLMDTDLGEVFSEDELEIVINKILENYLNLLQSKEEIIEGCQNQTIILSFYISIYLPYTQCGLV